MTRIAGNFAIVELHGELDLTCSPALRDQLLGLLRRRSSHLVLDLSAVTYCDASGLAVLVGTARRARLLAGSVRLAAISPQVEHALQLTGLHQHLDVFATVAAATAGPQVRATEPGGPAGPGGPTSPGGPGGPARAGPAASDLGVRVLPGPARGAGQPPLGSADVSQLREMTAALLTHADAWRDADPRRRFVPVLGAIADAWRGGDDTALEIAARTLISALARHPLSHSQAVASSATRLRRALDGARQPAIS